MKVRNCLVAQSGGPTAAINSTLAGVCSGAVKNSSIEKIYGGLNGIEGILQEKIIDLSEIFGGENLELLTTTPSSFLGSCRYKIKKEDFESLFKVFEKYSIKYFFYIGGNDSMDTILQLKEYQKVNGGDMIFVGVPKTIDNDLTCIDHTPGFGSAAKYIATSVKEIYLDACVYDMDSIVIVEVMGRNAGWLALAATLARDLNGNPCADLIYLPENTFDYDKFVEDVKRVQENKKQIVIVVSEGIKNAEGKIIAETGEKDNFGHGQLGGAGKHVEAELKRRIPKIKTRTVELSVLQRSAGHILSARDINEGIMIGEKAVLVALEGNSGVMVTSERIMSSKYELKLTCTEIEKIANKEKIVPESFMNEKKNQASNEALDYLKPLVEGEIYPPMVDGLPKYLFLKNLV